MVNAAPAVPGVAAPAATPPTPDPPPDAAPPEDPKVTQAVAIFDEARSLFQKGDFAAAQAKDEKALEVLPQDRVMHEFRALTLFAQGKYTEAAATLYAVMSAGPGWNWDTLKSFYSDPAVYTKQLRGLEAHSKANPQSADDRFVLAYHYLVLGQNDAAARELEQVTKLLPKDQLSAQILAALKPKPSDDGRPTPGAG
jgi:tetratricopeptide (TPR) repeat protein